MIDEKWLHESAASQRRALDDGTITAEALTLGYIERIERLNGELRGFVHLDAEGALHAAREADRRLSSGERTPALGLIIGIKDIIDVAGMPTTYGSRAFADNVAKQDATAVARLREAGAVILGKCNTFEFALVMPSPLHRESRNPWNLRRVAGGSSNGSATAVAASLCTLALGTDTAGSIRNPAAYCGVVGLKPSHGLVSNSGVGVLASSMDTVGPMTRSVEDVAMLLPIIAGHDPDDMNSAEVAPSEFGRTGPIGPVAVPRRWFPDLIDPEVEANWRETVTKLAAGGAEIVEVDLPDLSAAFDIWAGIAGGEGLEWHEEPLRTRRNDYGPAPLAIFERLKMVTAPAYVRAKRAAWRWRRDLPAAMGTAETMIVPTCPTTAFTFEEAKSDRIVSGNRTIDAGTATTGFTRIFSISGQPAVAVPSGIASNGMPLSVQVVGKMFGEAEVIAVARRVEAEARFPGNPPDKGSGL